MKVDSEFFGGYILSLRVLHKEFEIKKFGYCPFRDDCCLRKGCLAFDDMYCSVLRRRLG